MSHLNIESSYVFCKNIYIFPSSCLTSGLAVYFCKLTGCLMFDSLTLRSDSSQAGARWAVYSVIHSLVTPPAPLCISLYFCITARCEVCEVYFRSLIVVQDTWSILGTVSVFDTDHCSSSCQLILAIPGKDAADSVENSFKINCKNKRLCYCEQRIPIPWDDSNRDWGVVCW